MNFRATLSLLMFFIAAMPDTASGAGSPWGAEYFPNTRLVTQDGDVVMFFDDLIEGKIVAVNFIYTSCPDTCPLETAQLTRVQNILGDRLGQDIHFYSITIDPDHDTPEILKEYRALFGARWTFLTGAEDDIIELRRKLGLYVEEIQDGSNNHNVNMIIGNQATGRWMKRSPFENPHVLADQLGNWLDGWRSPPVGEDYANAPTLRDVPTGERLFRTRCATCHTITGRDSEGALGPDLMGVTERREMNWLLNWLRAPDQMLRKKDPIAMALAAQYNYLPMPNMRLNQQEAMDIIDYIENESRWIASSRSYGEVVAISDGWIRVAPKTEMNAGYMTLINSGQDSVTLVNLASDAFDQIDIHEMATMDGLMTMREIEGLVIPAGGRVELSPGGKHLMMRNPQQPIIAGEEVEITLMFDSGSSQTVVLVARSQ
jgi:copper(I)-binding protein/cytochrome oxidase Cu insertion factor (SCO1/SenC/PrrC family)